MEGVSLKEKAVFGGLLMLGLWAFAAVLYMVVFRVSWASAKDKLRLAEQKVAAERKMCSEKDFWDAQYESEVLKIPEVDERRSADTYWLGVIDSIASKHHVKTPSKTPNRPTVIEDMKQITIKVEWTGALESVVKFLYELETTSEGSFDVLDLEMKPLNKNNPGFLTGTMTVVCIFRRTSEKGN